MPQNHQASFSTSRRVSSGLISGKLAHYELYRTGRVMNHKQHWAVPLKNQRNEQKRVAKPSKEELKKELLHSMRCDQNNVLSVLSIMSMNNHEEGIYVDIVRRRCQFAENSIGTGWPSSPNLWNGQYVERIDKSGFWTVPKCEAFTPIPIWARIQRRPRHRIALLHELGACGSFEGGPEKKRLCKYKKLFDALA